MIQKGKDGNLKATGKRFSPGTVSEIEQTNTNKWWLCAITSNTV